MTTYQTPNVYVEEISTLPPSVAQVATAIPAFIGYTEKADLNEGGEIVPVRINSMKEYTQFFGGAHPTPFYVTTDANKNLERVAFSLPNSDSGQNDGNSDSPQKNGKDTAEETKIGFEIPDFLMYYTLLLFFSNGGSSCYIVSVGDYNSAKNKDHFTKGLEAIAKEDEPTLLMLTDAVNLEANAYYELCKETLKQCNKLKDRFAIFDVLASDKTQNSIGADFRNGIGQEYLKYGAAYYPYLRTTLKYHLTDDLVEVAGLPVKEKVLSGTYSTDDNGLSVTYSGSKGDTPKVAIEKANSKNITFNLDDTNHVLKIKVRDTGETPVNDILAAWKSQASKGSFELAKAGTGDVAVSKDVAETPLNLSEVIRISPADPNKSIPLGDELIKNKNTQLYHAIQAALNAKTVIMPPSGAIAGVYASTDRERGVWKAPANVSLASVVGPTVKLTNDDQDRLNIDPDTGKSINAIRSFTGRGTLVWGARTLDGNSNEWRYISVRRLFNLIEESIQKATRFAVFESNNVMTWLKVKTMIETYLEGLWRQGALAGNTTEEAFFVRVGLGCIPVM